MGGFRFVDEVGVVDSAHEDVAEEAEEKEGGHDVHGKVIAGGVGDVRGFLVFIEVTNEDRARDAGGGPCGEEAAVNGADFDCAEVIAEIGRDGGETTAVHGDDDDAEADEERDGIEAGGGGDQEEKKGAEQEEDDVCRFAADVVGAGGPCEATGHIEDGEESDEASGGNSGDAEEALDHRGGLFEDADAGGDVEEEDGPEEVELRGADGLGGADVAGGDEFVGVFGGSVSGGFPIRRREADGGGPEEHKDEVDGAHDEEGGEDAVGSDVFEKGHESGGERGTDHGAAAEAHDGHSSGHAGAIREPFNECGDRGNISDAEADASEYAVTEIDNPELVKRDAEGGDEESGCETTGGDEHGFAWTDSFQPGAEDRGGESEEDDGDGKDPGNGGVGPVACGGGDFDQRDRRAGILFDGEEFHEGDFEHGEGVDLPDGEVDGESGGRDEPAIKSGFGDNAVSIEDAWHGMLLLLSLEASDETKKASSGYF